MPIPIYIIASESVSHDRDSGLLSYFHVYERITISPVRPEQKKVVKFGTGLEVTVSAVWMMEESDVGEEFEFEAIVELGESGEKFPGPSGKFWFTGQRHCLHVVFSLTPFPPAGLLWFVVRIRAASCGEWQEQRYPVQIDVVPPT